ncbi:MAG: hypothetical protein FJ146_14655 [Deltaproteobacteria bacterium]|nr:hypothetical protein [Deltaproteobacteria bacterium]
MRHPVTFSLKTLIHYVLAAAALGYLGGWQITKHFDGLPPPGLARDGSGHPAAAGPPGTDIASLIPYAPAPHHVGTIKVTKNSTLSRTLQELGFLAPERAAILSALKPWTSPTRVRAGTAIKAYTMDAADKYPRRLDIELSDDLTVRLDQVDPGHWTASDLQIPEERRLAAYSGVVTGSLWNSAATAGMDPAIISRITEIFGWQMDFHREVQRGDRWRLTVEQFVREGRPVRIGAIVAAEYENSGVINTAVLDPSEGQYYTPEGNSLRRMFLRSPLRFARITSGFNAHRFHPILKVAKPHLGVDYGAPTGTPVMAIGSGSVTYAAYHGASGNTVSLRHNGTYSTHYKHLSRFAPDVRPGAQIKMGQIIGYVGKTGLATGPHLHFELHANGRYIDPAGVKLPTADPVPRKAIDSFKALASKALADLPPWSTATLTDVGLSGRQAELARKTN